MSDEQTQSQRYQLLFYLPQRPQNFVNESSAHRIDKNFMLFSGINFMYSQEPRAQNGRKGPSAFFAYESDAWRRASSFPGSLVEPIKLYGLEDISQKQPSFGLMCLLNTAPSNFLPEGVAEVPASSDVDFTAYAISGTTREELNRAGLRSIWASQRAAKSFTESYLPGFEVKAVPGKIIRLEDGLDPSGVLSINDIENFRRFN